MGFAQLDIEASNTYRLGMSNTNSFLNQTSVSSNVHLGFNDRLELKGSKEKEAEFPHLGRRFMPKNVGYALVVSGVADLFVLRLSRTKRMIGYQVQPVPDIPPDVNTVTFLINPAYTMNGSLDGMVGSAAADDKFYGHVPAMRHQYGSQYPASYFRPQEAYALKKAIEQEDKEREAFYVNYNSRMLDEALFARQIPSDEVPQGGTDKDSQDKTRDAAQSQANKQSDDMTAQITKQDQAIKGSKGNEEWQKKMEELIVKAGKRNIVNTYVWDADGGLRSETQEFAGTVEHTIGGSFSFDGSIGLDLMFNFVVQFEASAMANVHLTQTTSKTEARSKGFSLNVEVGCENQDVTNHLDTPLYPGEKVDRYRFMSFYLAGNTDHFNHFFDQVVDPIWLQGQDEEAETLRTINRTKPNKTWRVLHRVTYIERPIKNEDTKNTKDTKNATTTNPSASILPSNLPMSALQDQIKQIQTMLDSLVKKLNG